MKSLLASFLLLAALAAPLTASAAVSVPRNLSVEGVFQCADGKPYSSYGNVLNGRLSVWELYRRLACAKGDRSLYSRAFGK